MACFTPENDAYCFPNVNAFLDTKDLLCHLNCVPFIASECISQFHEFLFKWVVSSPSRRNQPTPRSTHLKAILLSLPSICCAEN